MRLVPVLFALICCAVAATAAAPAAVAAPAPGELDPSFGQGGVAAGEGFVSDGWATMAVGLEGEIFVLAPSVTNCGPTELCKTATLKLARYDADGNRDPVFGAAAQLAVHQNQYEHSALAVDPEGRPVIAALDERRLIVARFGHDGALDPGFGTLGVANSTLGEARGTAPVVAVQADGKVLVAYEASETGIGAATEGRLVVARFLANGNLDPGFGENGMRTIVSTYTHPAALAFRQSGGFDVGLSRCCRGEGGADVNVGVDRFLSNGSLDPSLAGTGLGLIPRATPSYLEAIAAGPGGRVYVVANEETRGSILLRLQPGGSLDPSFGKGGEVSLGRVFGLGTNVSGIAADGSGRVVGVVGYYGAGSHVFRLLKNGAPDPTFAAGKAVELPNPGVNASSSGFGLQSGGRIVLILESGNSSGRGYSLARLVGGSSKVRCLGKRATIVGTREAEKIVGTRGRDVIAALGGADTVRGLGGDDLICGGKGRDKLFGGGGRDKVRQ
jgi:uncharacterized delta-60 repeat protein